MISTQICPELAHLGNILGFSWNQKQMLLKVCFERNEKGLQKTLWATKNPA